MDLVQSVGKACNKGNIKGADQHSIESFVDHWYWSQSTRVTESPYYTKMGCCLLLVVLTFSHVLLSAESTNPQISEPQDQAQDPFQDSIAACIDSISLDQQLVKTMVISQQKQITQLQDQLLHNAGIYDKSVIYKHVVRAQSGCSHNGQ